MRITIEDLEAIKELNDEIEEDHVETEKAMQRDLGVFICVSYTLMSTLRIPRREGCPNSGSNSES
jgi:hypothetical protein